MYNNMYKDGKKLIKDAREGRVTVKGIYLPETIARGKVLKKTVYQAEPTVFGEITEISVLYLSPGAEILEHTHVTDREVYYVGGLQLTCEAGQSHSYENATRNEEVIVAVKQAIKL